MKYYYIAGIPYPDELYHYGIKGQKWGVRRFQNADGSYTLVGKQRYGRISEDTMNKLKSAGSKIASGTKKAAKAVGSAAKKLKDRKVQQYKMKHPWMMSDEELKRETDRINMEAKYKQAIEDLKSKNRVKRVARDILESGAKIIGDKAFKSIADKIFGEKDTKIRDLEDVLSDEKATQKDLDLAKKAWDAKQQVQKYKDSKKVYDFKAIGDTSSMSKHELDNLGAWFKSQEAVMKKVPVSRSEAIVQDSDKKRYDKWLEERDIFNRKVKG